MVLHYSL